MLTLSHASFLGYIRISQFAHQPFLSCVGRWSHRYEKHQNILQAYPNHNRIPNILINRMVINLRVYDSDGPPAGIPSLDYSSGMAFSWNPWLDNIGFSLDTDERDDERGGDFE